MATEFTVYIVLAIILVGVLWLTRPRPKPMVSRVVEGFSGKPLSETEAGKIGAAIMNGHCPDCGSKEGFWEGPQGGASVNIFCVTCRQGFNFTNMFGEGHAERIHKLLL
jgi:hypothetical protein